MALVMEKHPKAANFELAEDDLARETCEVFRRLPPNIFIEESKDKMYVQIGEFNGTGLQTRIFDNSADLEEYLETSRTPSCAVADQGSIDASTASRNQAHAHFVLLRPSFGWGRLLITERAMAKILERFRVFPLFLKYLKVFGEKGFAKDEGFAGYDVLFARVADGTVSAVETCFLWKYVEAGDSDARYQYTIRQALIYQKYNVATASSTNILVRIPREVAQKLKSSLTSGPNGKGEILYSWTEIYVLFAGAGLDDWRAYINHLDGEVAKLFDTLIISNVDPNTFSEVDQVSHCLTSMKQLQFLVDQILRTLHMLDLNTTTLNAISKTLSRMLSVESDCLALQGQLEGFSQEYSFLHKMAKSLLDRATMLSQQLRDIISLRNHEINRRAADSTSQGTHAIVELSRKSAYEAWVVKTLTIVAIVFVPASFTADFLQMGYLSVIKNEPFSIKASVQIWLWVVLATPLIMLTVIVYVICECVGRRSIRKQCLRLEDEAQLRL